VVALAFKQHPHAITPARIGQAKAVIRGNGPSVDSSDCRRCLRSAPSLQCGSGHTAWAMNRCLVPATALPARLVSWLGYSLSLLSDVDFTVSSALMVKGRARRYRSLSAWACVDHGSLVVGVWFRHHPLISVLFSRIGLHQGWPRPRGATPSPGSRPADPLHQEAVMAVQAVDDRQVVGTGSERGDLPRECRSWGWRSFRRRRLWCWAAWVGFLLRVVDVAQFLEGKLVGGWIRP
jgi:hypothetical protein